MEVVMNIAGAVRDLRDIETQVEFAERLHIHSTVLCGIEKGRLGPTPRILAKLACHAHEIRRFDLAAVFFRELEQQLMPPPDLLTLWAKYWRGGRR
jgi:DNA-binding XRE family transcriptional regulator